MGYVKITGPVKDAIKYRIDKMTDSALAAYEVPSIEAGSDLEAQVLEAATQAAWSAAPEWRGKIPEQLLVPITHVSASIAEGPDTNRGCVHSVSLEAPIRLPYSEDIHTYSYRSDMQLRVKIQYENTTGELREYLDLRRTQTEEARKVADQYNAVKEQVLRFLNTHASLNAAIKEMPELEMYLSYDLKERLYKKPEKRANVQAQRPVVEVDRDALASLAVADRIAKSR